MPEGFAARTKELRIDHFFHSPPDIDCDKVMILLVRTATKVTSSVMNCYPNLRCIIRSGSG
ncbi:MAG: hypothetical protein K8S56_08725, partial [Candidatus Cloacimonetes bacterium]|nr:hypothetical protein [Candidatus Cloacimonadota bacterium]